MKLEPAPKLDKRNIATSKKFDIDVVSENCDVIVIFQIFSQFGGVRRPDSGTESAKVMLSVTVTFCLTKTKNRTLTQLSHYYFE